MKRPMNGMNQTEREINTRKEKGFQFGPTSVEDEQLAHCRANAKNKQMDNHLRVILNKFQLCHELLLVHEGDEGEDGGERVHDQHHLQRAQLLVQLEHSCLPLASEGVEEEEEDEEHHAAGRASHAQSVPEHIFPEVNVL